jgi:hypothetical protein
MKQKIELYIISLWFLFLLLFINKVQVPLCFGDGCSFIGFRELLLLNVVPTFSLGFIILGAIFYWRFNYKVEKGATDLPMKITSIEDLYFENLSFLITYIIPLVGFDLDNNRNRLMLFLVLLLIGWFYVKANIFYTNPSLAVLGYRIYKVNTEMAGKNGVETATNMIVIVRGRLKQNDVIRPKILDDNILFVTKAEARQ